MARETPEGGKPAAATPLLSRRIRSWRGLAWLIGILAALGLLVAGGITWINSDAGHRFLAQRVSDMRFASGLRITIGAIDGNVLAHARLRDVRFYDLDGRFANVAEAELQWYPLAWLSNRLDVDRLAIGEAWFDRMPRLKASAKRTSILPGFDIRAMDVRIRRLHLGKAVVGQAHTVEASGRADIRSGRAIVALNARAIDTADAMRLSLDSRPDDRKFDVDVVAAAPRGGILAHLSGLPGPMALAVKGKGDWTQWRGRLIALQDKATLANIVIDQREGRFRLAGPLSLIGPLRPLGEGTAMLGADLRLEKRVLEGTASLQLRGVEVAADGGVDLGRSRFDDLRLSVLMRDPARLSPGLAGKPVELRARLAGPFETAAVDYLLNAPDLQGNGFKVVGLRVEGEGQLAEGGGVIPLTLRAQGIQLGVPALDERLRDFTAQGQLRIADGQLVLAPTRLRARGFEGTLDAQARLAGGPLAVNLKGALGGLELPGLGRLDLDAVVRIGRQGNERPSLSGRTRARLLRLDNGFLRSLGEGLPELTSDLALDGQNRLLFRNLHLTSPALTLDATGVRADDGSMHFEGSGRHRSYGPLRVTLDGMIERPRVDLTLDRPMPALQLRAVHLLLTPDPGGYDVSGTGGSMLGPFTLDGRVALPAGGDARIDVSALRFGDVLVAGQIVPVSGGLKGTLAISGPADGQIALSMANGVQMVGLDADLSGAHFAGPPSFSINRGSVHADIALHPGATSIEGQVQARGLRYGTARIGRLAGTINLVNGSGSATVSLNSGGGRSFDMQARADISPDALALQMQGTIDRRSFTLARPARLTREGEGWRLAPATLRVNGGELAVAGYAGPDRMRADARMTKLPLVLLDLVNGDLGLGGTAEGSFSFDQPIGGVGTGKMDLRVRGLTRSGLALSSAPIDLGINAVLGTDRAAMRAIVAEGGKVTGRAQALLAPLAGGTLMERLAAAPVQAQLRYAGSADTLWRLTNIELLSLGGQVRIDASAVGTLNDPRISGTVAAQDASLQSPATGMSLRNVSAQGRFTGPELTLENIKGETPGGGTVTGSARFSFSAESGVGMDVALKANRAVLLDRDDVGATATGDLQLRSTGSGGTISGDLDVVSSRFMLGRASAVAEIPQIRLIEINRSGEQAEPSRPARPWQLDINARVNDGLRVEGLGMQSEWSANLHIGGAVTAPVFLGTANLVRGSYDFAGKRFDLREGQLTFNGATPVNPTLDIRAEANVTDLSATITVTGSSLRPIVSFTSVPALPQDELLSRILFGTSVTQLSAPEALQLASAVAAFQGGGGALDPINAVRRATGLSRLRILPADTATGAKTSIAAGKNIGRNLYVELITDGQGYSATRVEFQITRWLALLSTVSTIGRQSISARVSKDY